MLSSCIYFPKIEKILNYNVHVGKDMTLEECKDLCVADMQGRLINNSSVTFRSFINIAGNYHSFPFTCPNIFHNRRTTNSGFGLQVLPTSLIHTNNRSNILPVLLNHKSTFQFTNNSFHFITDQLYIFPPAIHTANRIANKIVPLASKPIMQVHDNLSDHRDITLEPARDVHFGGWFVGV